MFPVAQIGSQTALVAQGPAQPAANLACHVGEFRRDLLRSGKQEVAAARAQARHDQPGIVAAVDHDSPSKLFLDRVPESDTGECRQALLGDQRGGQLGPERRARLSEAADANDRSGRQPWRRAATFWSPAPRYSSMWKASATARP